MAFRRTVDAAVAPLRAALDAGDWRALQPALASIPTRADGAAASVEKLRVAVDALIEEVSFATAFERAFVVRRALHRIGIAPWLVAALRGTHPASPVLRRLALLTEMLATTEEGRTLLGRARCVDVLVRLWRRAPASPEIVAALAALCAGHIDNVSRMMRSTGVTVAVSVVSDLLDRAEAGSGTDGPSLEPANAALLSRVLLLLGLVAICTPDSREEAGMLVPALVRAAKVARAARASRPLADAVAALGSIGTCWIKEGAGYLISADGGLRDAAVDAWRAAPRNTDIVSPAAWALCGFYRAHPTAVVPPTLAKLLARSGGRVASVRALKAMVAEGTGVVAESIPSPAAVADTKAVDVVVAKKSTTKKTQKKKTAKVDAKPSPSRKRKSTALEPESKSPKRRRARQTPKRHVVVKVSSPEVCDTDTEAESSTESVESVPATPRRAPSRKKSMASPNRIQDVQGSDFHPGSVAQPSPRRRVRSRGKA